jgi:hypothetical protein
MELRRLRLFAVVFAAAAISGLLAVAFSPSASATRPEYPCTLFPANNIWNTRVDNLPVDPHSRDYINRIGANTGLHPDFGSGTWNDAPIGIPYVVVPTNQPLVQVTFDIWDESDAGPYPIPTNAPIEGLPTTGPTSTPPVDGDRHVLVMRQGDCRLYETWYTWQTPQPSFHWWAGSGALFNLNSNALRPNTWTSADAAGLPILAGLVNYDEVASGEIRHAIRFTANDTQRAYVWPARHYASTITDPTYPPMGQRFRLKANVDISGFSPEVRVILTAFKRYGVILADNGSSWYISGIPDERWNNDNLVGELGQIQGSDFEAVDVRGLMIDPNSGQARQLTPRVYLPSVVR